MKSSRPYLIRAIYEWLIDCDLTPYLMVDATVSMVRVPEQHIEDGKIVLNINPLAVANMHMRNEVIEFDARFSGVSHHIFIPIQSVRAIYAFENGRGMVFDEDDENWEDEEICFDSDDSDDPSDDGNPKNKKTKPSLRIVK